MNITALHIPIGSPPRLVKIDEEAPGPLGELVGGDFQCVGLSAGIGLWVNENGKGLGLPWNQHAQALWDHRFGAGTDFIVGPAVLTSGVDDRGMTLGITEEQLRLVEEILTLVRVRIENTYEDGHESTAEVWLSNPDDTDDALAIESWWEDVVFDHVGDGHGAEHPNLGSDHECTIVSGPAQLVGKTYGWGG